MKRSQKISTRVKYMTCIQPTPGSICITWSHKYYQLNLCESQLCQGNPSNPHTSRSKQHHLYPQVFAWNLLLAKNTKCLLSISWESFLTKKGFKMKKYVCFSIALLIMATIGTNFWAILCFVSVSNQVSTVLIITILSS